MSPVPRLIATISLMLLISGCANGLFYLPDHKRYYTPENYEDLWFDSADGTRLHAWLVASKKETALGTVVHFHGNAQNLSAHIGFTEWLTTAEFDVFAFDYRGYGQSQGSPDRIGTIEDGVAALKFISRREDSGPLLVVAQSLGAAIAVAALSKPEAPKVEALILESPFSSYRRIAKDKIADIPILSLLRVPLSYLLITDGESPVEFVGKLAPTPVLLIHGTDDEVVPYYHAEALFSEASEPKGLWQIEGGGHTEAFTRFGEVYQPKLVRYFKEVLSKKSVRENREDLTGSAE